VKVVSVFVRFTGANMSRVRLKLHARLLRRKMINHFDSTLLTMYFHGARFSNYEAWLTDPTHIKPSAQIVYAVVGQEILNGDVGGGFKVFKLLQVSSNYGVVQESQANYNIHYSHWWFNFSWCDVLCGLVPLPQSSS
jgi:hypothetical protein